METLIASSLLLAIVGLYLWGYIMNGRTPYPEGVVPILSCEICTTNCHVHPDNMTEALRNALAQANKLPDCETKAQ